MSSCECNESESSSKKQGCVRVRSSFEEALRNLDQPAPSEAELNEDTSRSSISDIVPTPFVILGACVFGFFLENKLFMSVLLQTGVL